MKYPSRVARFVLTPCCVFVACAYAARAGDVPTYETFTGTQNSGAVYEIAYPVAEEWNGGLIVFAHGYVDTTEPIEIPRGQLDFGDALLPQVATDLGYAFAVTSYSVNGLAVKEGLEDVVDLVDIFTADFGEPDPVYIFGVSMGGLVATLALERHSGVFDGGICACGPIGDFNVQTAWFNDFRVVFDYFFPGVVPGDAVNVPVELFENWDQIYARSIKRKYHRFRNLGKLRQLVKVTGAPIDPNRKWGSLEDTVEDMLYGGVRATNDSMLKLGGSNYDNESTEYAGSRDDERLNAEVDRFSADAAALFEVSRFYQTTGALSVPIVTLHTTLDPQVPYQHMSLYRAKTVFRGNPGRLLNLRIERYGHCKFTEREALIALGLLILRVEGAGAALPIALEELLPFLNDKTSKADTTPLEVALP